MGRSYTPTYRLVLPNATPMAWKREYGRPNAANIEKYIRRYVESQRPGGCNAHIAKSLGYLDIPNKGRVIRQADNKVVAEWEAPAFWCF